MIFSFDLLAVALAWIGGFLVRFNFEWPTAYEHQMAVGLVVLLITQTLASRWAGLYRGMWIFASLPDLKRVLKAVMASSVVLIALVAVDRGNPPIPRSLMLVYPVLLLVVMGGGRAMWRMWKEHRLYGGLIAQGKPVVVVGAGSGGLMLVRALERCADWRVVALVDDDGSKHGLELCGRRVTGSVRDLPAVLEDSRAKHVILAMPSAAGEVLRRATDLAVRAGAQVFTVPGLEDLMSGRVAINSMRPVAIEDLLGRDPVRIDVAHVGAMLSGKTVMVTGAGGSIGSELCRQLARFSPRRLMLFEANEFALYQIEQWFTQHKPEIEIVCLAGDVKDGTRLDEVFIAHSPQVVFHAAAYKHVPLMEVRNAWQAVRNNVLGTLRVAEHAQRYGAERFVLISTDKAVNPTNVMGATKRLAEMVCEALHSRGGATQFEMVRFGNVLGSTGSVIPKFQEQIARGGPVTVTHPEINRYFMSIPEAAQLVLQAAAMGQGGEVFVLDMGEPVKIVDLARNMIRLSGYSEEEIRIEFTGLRPGEKLYEELLADSEVTRETPHPKLRIARSRPVAASFLAELEAWLARSGPVSDDEVRRGLQRWVPEYAPAPARPALRVVEGAGTVFAPARAAGG
ncbi:MAG: nucleoside-diphosphate sugar epimerase/dehydratase [Aromatoleum sp.]|jgi:FlaA1/EpsC-like NDP-sugar epimerase|uniref:polysaccharide biosynthesis protein n=1 Tax=Aromatoleum sp. TaxID=2307007 RepID=UPI0028946841|nr:nucleoside-diphosphate sugar epimerase/dehydratase [Aromatoleum sp.]MDT3671419.1 nucleoside-diphosphate sugar epimerase/dehydratase [Aromatoleum sp.]